jgi:valyl-tRNA synthetase
VRSVRNARAEYAVEPAKRIPAFAVVTKSCADGGLEAALAEELALVATLARLDVEASSVSSEPPAAAVADPGAFVQLVVSEGLEVYLPLSGIVDPKKEIARLTKQAVKLEKEASGLAGKGLHSSPLYDSHLSCFISRYHWSNHVTMYA